MVKKETYFQVGICPHCPDNTRQVFVEGIHEYSEEIPDQRGKRYVYGDVHTLSFFRCDSCHTIVGYRTYYADAVDIAWAEKLDKKWVLHRDDCGNDPCFKAHASLIYLTHRKASNRTLSEHVPDRIKSLYDRALKVKDIEPNSFVVHIRHALETLCIDRGARTGNLRDKLAKLSERGVFPPLVEQIANEVRLIGNDGAHGKRRDVEPKRVPAIDDFFHLVLGYVYDAPARLNEFRKHYTPDLPEINSGDAVN